MSGLLADRIDLPRGEQVGEWASASSVRTLSVAVGDQVVNALPQFLTVEEAASVVRIGRTAAYQLAARYEATDGREGLPVVRFGRLLRVPRARLEDWAGGPLDAPSDTDDRLSDRTASRTESAQGPPPRRNVQAKRCARQPQLPFES